MHICANDLNFSPLHLKAAWGGSGHPSRPQTQSRAGLHHLLLKFSQKSFLDSTYTKNDNAQWEVAGQKPNITNVRGQKPEDTFQWPPQYSCLPPQLSNFQSPCSRTLELRWSLENLEMNPVIPKVSCPSHNSSTTWQQIHSEPVPIWSLVQDTTGKTFCVKLSWSRSVLTGSPHGSQEPWPQTKPPPSPRLSCHSDIFWLVAKTIVAFPHPSLLLCVVSWGCCCVMFVIPRRGPEQSEAVWSEARRSNSCRARCGNASSGGGPKSWYSPLTGWNLP